MTTNSRPSACRRHPRCRFPDALVVGIALVAVTISTAVSGQETPETFEFSFSSNPGARSLGLGGAFAGLADDATAAFANPAGLVQLARPEVSLEGRLWSYSTPYVAGGRYEGSPTGIGIDTVRGLRSARSLENTNGLSFASLVYPHARWALALYRHQLAKFRTHTQTQGLFGLAGDGVTTTRSFDRIWSTDLDIVGYGISGAYRIAEHFSLGLAVVAYQGRLNAPFRWYWPDDDSLGAVFGPNSYLPENQLIDGDMGFDDSDWGLSAGLLWELAERWKLGAFYRQGPEFDVLFAVRAAAAGSILEPSWSPGEELLAVAGSMRFPDVYGLGIAFRSREGRLAVGFEWDRVSYSTIFSSFGARQVGGIDQDPDLEVQLAADDGDELHLGAEYAFIESTPVIAVRAGAWLDPDHRFRSISRDAEHRALFLPATRSSTWRRALASRGRGSRSTPGSISPTWWTPPLFR